MVEEVRKGKKSGRKDGQRKCDEVEKRKSRDHSSFNTSSRN